MPDLISPDHAPPWLAAPNQAEACLTAKYIYILTQSGQSMRVLCICDAADGLPDLAMRAQATGHAVKVFIRKFDQKTRPVGRGLVELVPDFHGWLRWADLILLEGNNVYMAEADNWRKQGMLVIGGGVDSASWELDREVGMRVLRRAGIPLLPYRLFNDYDQAIRYVERRGEPLYSKPSSGSADKSLSARTGVAEDVSWQLRQWKAKHGKPPSEFLLQDPVEGVEFAVGAWFGPAGFAPGWEENFEGKRMVAGDLGRNSGEMYTVMRYVARSKLAQQMLVPLEEELARIGFVGNVDLNTIVSDGTPYPLEFTTRFGWPAFHLESDLFNCDPIEFLYALAAGETIPRDAHKMNEIAVGVVLAIGCYPDPPRSYDDIVGVPIYGADEGFHPTECQRGEDSPLATAGHYVGVSVGTGSRVSEAARQAYRQLKKISMPCGPFWRIDAGLRLRRELDQLQAHGFAVGLEY